MIFRSFYIRSNSSSIVTKEEILDELREFANRVPFNDRGNPDISIEHLSPLLIQEYLKTTIIRKYVIKRKDSAESLRFLIKDID